MTQFTSEQDLEECPDLQSIYCLNNTISPHKDIDVHCTQITQPKSSQNHMIQHSKNSYHFIQAYSLNKGVNKFGKQGCYAGYLSCSNGLRKL
jgi:hypothetical protein